MALVCLGGTGGDTIWTRFEGEKNREKKEGGASEMCSSTTLQRICRIEHVPSGSLRSCAVLLGSCARYFHAVTQDGICSVRKTCPRGLCSSKLSDNPQELFPGSFLRKKIKNG